MLTKCKIIIGFYVEFGKTKISIINKYNFFPQSTKVGTHKNKSMTDLPSSGVLLTSINICLIIDLFPGCGHHVYSNSKASFVLNKSSTFLSVRNSFMMLPNLLLSIPSSKSLTLAVKIDKKKYIS